MSESILVIKYGRESYVQARHSSWMGQVVVNGRADWPQARGDSSFVVVQGDVKTIVRQKKPSKVVTRYTLRPDLTCANKPAWLTPAQFEALDEADEPLYAPEYEEQTPPPEPQAVRVVDGKAAPRQLPHGVVPVLPHHVNTWPWFWWTLPCVATWDYTFEELKRRVSALDPAQFAVTVYSNIKHIRVEAHTFSLGGVRFRPEGCLLYLDRDKERPEFRGATADEAIAKAHAFIDEKMAAIVAAANVTVCPCCQGKLAKGRKAHLTARDGNRYRRNEHHIS